MYQRNLVFMCLIGLKFLFNSKSLNDHKVLIINKFLFNLNSEIENVLINSNSEVAHKLLIINRFLFNLNSESL